ncbi:MAG TPA: hypothetical protein PLS49_01015, partial [Candidatus Woesebacteria bacterium]|nr:hypothetical protein [Candidatus Woesebacteria bacterium]
STGMFTVNKCSWAGQQHCRWVATELNFYPDAGCSYITFKGNKVNGMSLTMDVPSSKAGHRTFGWGVSTLFANTNSGWQNNSNWRYFNTCR